MVRQKAAWKNCFLTKSRCFPLLNPEFFWFRLWLLALGTPVPGAEQRWAGGCARDKNNWAKATYTSRFTLLGMKVHGFLASAQQGRWGSICFDSQLQRGLEASLGTPWSPTFRNQLLLRAGDPWASAACFRSRSGVCFPSAHAPSCCRQLIRQRSMML